MGESYEGSPWGTPMGNPIGEFRWEFRVMSPGGAQLSTPPLYIAYCTCTSTIGEKYEYHFKFLDIAVSDDVCLLKVSDRVKLNANEVLPEDGQQVKAKWNVGAYGDSKQLQIKHSIRTRIYPVRTCTLNSCVHMY